MLKKHNKIFCLIAVSFLVFFTNITIKGMCADSEISSMIKYASNINLSLDYHIENDIAYFDITLNNLVPQLYIYDMENDMSYYFEDSNDGELVISGITKERGEFQILSNSEKCSGQNIAIKKYILPSYNKYYTDIVCVGNEEHSLCQKWKKTNFTYEEFKKNMEEYQKTKAPKEEIKKEEVKQKLPLLDIFVDFYVKYYYIILSLIIIICITVMIINVKKNKFNL